MRPIGPVPDLVLPKEEQRRKAKPTYSNIHMYFYISSRVNLFRVAEK
jgi:hypothetical protein